MRSAYNTPHFGYFSHNQSIKLKIIISYKVKYFYFFFLILKDSKFIFNTNEKNLRMKTTVTQVRTGCSHGKL